MDKNSAFKHRILMYWLLLFIAYWQGTELSSTSLAWLSFNVAKVNRLIH